MKILVCLKQVPDTQDIKWTEKGTMIREGVESIINPYDEYALEYALEIKEKFPETKVTALSMGPLQAKSLLKVAIAKGADDAILACDKKFAGADTFATSMTLAQTIKTFAPDFDLILCGQFAIDGDTAQTAPSLAQHLDIPSVTFVKEIINTEKTKLIVQRETDEGFIDAEISLPAVVSVLRKEQDTQNYTIKGYLKACETEIKIVNKDDIKIDENFIGFKGSPTYVAKSFPPNFERKSEKIEASTILSIIKEKTMEGKQ